MPGYTLSDYLTDTAYFQQRLHMANQATELPISARFDLARSPVNDATLEQITQTFGAKPSPGFGFADVLDAMLSQDFKKVPVRDLASLQSNLQRQGYLPPDYQPTGIWDPISSAAFHRSDRDAYSKALEGNHVLAAPVSAAIGILGDTMPTSVFTGIVAAAKGFVKETPEVVSRAGLVGGAVEGAIIGGSIASIIPGPGTAAGALVGGAIGAAAGFLGSIFGNHQNLIESLSPLDDYQREGLRSFFEDVGWVSTAAMAASAVKIGAAGVTAGLSAARLGTVEVAEVAAGPAALPGLAEAMPAAIPGAGSYAEQVARSGMDVGLIGRTATAAPEAVFAGPSVDANITLQGLMKTQNVEPGWLTRWATGRSMASTGESAVRGGVKRFTAGAALGAGVESFTPGGMDPKRLAEAGLLGGLGALTLGTRFTRMYDQATIWGLAAQASRPIVQVARGAYTGFSVFNVGARLVAKLPGETPMDQAFRQTPKLPDFLNMAAFLLYPSRLLPGRLKETGAAIEAALGDASLLPGIHVIQQQYGLSLADAKAKLLELLGPDDASRATKWTYALVAHGVEREAFQRATDLGRHLSTEEFWPAVRRFRFEINAKLFEEADAASGEFGAAAASIAGTFPVGKGPTMEKVLSWNLRDPSGEFAQKGPALFESYLMDLTRKGSGIERFDNFVKASERAYEVTREYRAGHTKVYQLNPKGELVPVVPGFKSESVFGIEELKAEIRRKESELEQFQLETSRSRLIDPADIVPRLADQKTMEDEIGRLRDEYKGFVRQKVKRTAEQVIIAPATLDTPSREMLIGLAETEKSLRETMQNAALAGEGASYQIAHEQYADFLNKLVDDGHVPALMRDRAIVFEPETRIERMLRAKAKVVAKDVVLPPEEMKAWADLGYKPVSVGEDMLYPQEMPALMESMGVADYTRRRGFWESLGTGTRPQNNAELNALRSGNWRFQIDLAIKLNQVHTTPEDVIARLWTALDLQNSKARVTNESVMGARGILPRDQARAIDQSIGDVIVQHGMLRGKPGIGIHMPAFNATDLSPDLVYSALADIPGATEKFALNVHAGLKRGSAFGGEFNPLHPIATATMMGRNFRANGLLGFSDLMRTWHFASGDSLRLKGEKGYHFGPGGARSALIAATAGAAGGGALGAMYGDDPKDIIKGAIGGAFVTMGVRWLANRNYGYLPDELIQMNYALRFGLSPLFDLRRLVKQNVIDGSTGEAMFVLPKKYAQAHSLPSLVDGHIMEPAEVWPEVVNHWKELTGGGRHADIVNELDRISQQEGILGYNPKERQMLQAFLMRSKGYSTTKIKTAIADLYGYGFGRTALEKSTNFLFFPFSFEKKLLTHVASFILQQPGRNLLFWEGSKRYHEAHFDTKVKDFLNDHAPLLQELSSLNAFHYGLSPGQFWLQGIMDRRTGAGKVSELAANIIVPGAVATRFAQTVGTATDLAIHGFSPLVLDGESITSIGSVKNASDLMARYIPFIKDLNNIYTAGMDQAIALSSGESKWSQIQDYQAGVDEAKKGYESLARVFGHTTVDGFFASSEGQPFYEQYQAQRDELHRQFPVGWSESQKFAGVNYIELNRGAIEELAQKAERSSAENAILALAQEEANAKRTYSTIGLPTEVSDQIITQRMRSIAEKWADDRSFVEMWNQLFEFNYGPITRVA